MKIMLFPVRMSICCSITCSYHLSFQVRNLGKPVELAGQYYKDGADEVFLNI